MYAARSWGYRHPYVCTGVRITAGTWNLVLGILRGQARQQDRMNQGGVAPVQLGERALIATRG